MICSSSSGRADSIMERILLSTSLLRLGEGPAVTPGPEDVDDACESFAFFIGSPFTAADLPLTRKLAPHDLFHVGLRCRARTLALASNTRFSPPDSWKKSNKKGQATHIAPLRPPTAATFRS